MNKLFILISLFFTTDASALVVSDGIFNNVLNKYEVVSRSWATVISHHAQWLFWTLALISMVWTFGMMALKRSDLGEVFAEFIRFTIFTGFFWWLLINGPDYAIGLIESMKIIAGTATGLGSELSPSGIVEIGFNIFNNALSNTISLSPFDSFIGVIISTIILVVLTLIGVNMLLLMITSWILAYAGIFFLGFGGSRWTSDMAINYYKTVLGIAVQIFTMTLLIGIGSSFVNAYYQAVENTNEIGNMGVMLVVAIILLVLTNKVPSLLAGIITGANVGNQGIGNFGAGAITGAAGMAAAGASSGGAALASGAASAGSGGASAVKAAIAKAASNISNGTNTFSTVTGSRGGFRSGSKTESGGDASSPLGRAMGFSSGSGKGAIDSANLAKAGFDIDQNKVSTHREGYKERVANTAGGQMGNTITNSGNPTKNNAGDSR